MVANRSRRSRRRLPALILASVVLVAMATAGPAGAADTSVRDDPPTPSLIDCIGGQAPEIYGVTDISAQSANGGLSVALNAQGTVTVLRWPSPSYYDQVRFTTGNRDEPNLGVADDEGAFLGLSVTLDDGTSQVTWLRDWSANQRYAEGWTDEIVTSYRNDELRLTVTDSAVNAHPDDVFARRVKVTAADDSPVAAAKLLSFENLSLVTSKQATLPVQDWCFESQNTDVATYDDELDAVVHSRTGIDESTGKKTSVAIAVGFDRPTTAHTVGGDSQADGPPSAYVDAADGQLSGNDRVEGQTTSVLATDLDLDDGSDTAMLIMAADADVKGAKALLTQARDGGFAALSDTKRTWLEGLLADAPMPATDDADVLALARRALVTLVTDVDRKSGAIVASIATQSPYGEDWPRDGAFFDYALDLIGLHDWVDRHHEFYVAAQQTENDPDPTLTKLGVPPGNWGMNYYADGVVGGPIAWEIDETGYAIWNFWEHSEATDDRAALRAVYPTIERAADFLAECRDDANGLQCKANEDDNYGKTQTVVGAGTTWLGLDAAVNAAQTLGEAGDAKRWAKRRDALGEAVDANLWKGDRWGGGSAPLAWPVCFAPYDSPRMTQHLDALQTRLDKTFAEPAAGKKLRGSYETKGLLALAKAGRDDPERLAWVRDGLQWTATEHAMEGTHILGESWRNVDGEIISIVSQPHAWEQVLFYLASLEAWPPSGFADTPSTCDGVLGALRTASTSNADEAAAKPATAGGGGGMPAIAIGAGVVVVAVLLGVVLLVVRRRRTGP